VEKYNIYHKETTFITGKHLNMVSRTNVLFPLNVDVFHVFQLIGYLERKKSYIQICPLKTCFSFSNLEHYLLTIRSVVRAQPQKTWYVYRGSRRVNRACILLMVHILGTLFIVLQLFN
jgi:hypothetical protein